LGGKSTTIELQTPTNSVIDGMVTNHFVTGHHGLYDHVDIIAHLHDRVNAMTIDGEVTRIKLEHEYLHPLSSPRQIDHSLSICIYAEAHIKCVSVSDAQLSIIKELCHPLLDWRMSRNPKVTNSDGSICQFVNRRFYHPVSTHVDSCVDDMYVVLMREGIQIEEIKFESVVYDSNERHDYHWMVGSSACEI